MLDALSFPLSVVRFSAVCAGALFLVPFFAGADPATASVDLPLPMGHMLRMAFATACVSRLCWAVACHGSVSGMGAEPGVRCNDPRTARFSLPFSSSAMWAQCHPEVHWPTDSQPNWEFLGFDRFLDFAVQLCRCLEASRGRAGCHLQG